MKETIKLAYDIGRPYSDDFYKLLALTKNLDFGFWIPIITLLFVFLVTVSYYYLIDRPKTGNLIVWVLFLVGTGIISGIFAYIKANNSIIDYYTYELRQVSPDFGGDLAIFASIHFVYTLIVFLLVSIFIKWWSTNSSHVPF